MPNNPISNFMGKTSARLQNVGKQIRKNEDAGQADPRSTRADYSINPLKGTLKAFEKTPSYKKGGKVKKTGKALLHKGEVVVPKKSVKGKSFKQIQASVRKTMGY